jgi:predicted dehydrogenase
MTTTQQLRAAVIGCGGHAQFHFRMIAQEPRVHLTAIAEIDPQRLEKAAAEHRPGRAFGDYRQMLDHCELDLVHVTTMPGHLVPIVLECLERGLHVSVEKPPGMNSADTRKLAQAAGRSRGKAMVSFNRRYLPQVLAVRRLIRQRGGAVHCAGTYNKDLTVLGAWGRAGLVPDPVVCDAIHHVDLLRWLAGPAEGEAALPVEVHSLVQDGNRLGAHRHNALVRFSTGAFGVLMSHYGVGGRVQRAEVHAEDFSAYLELTGPPQVELFQAHATPEETTAGQRVEQLLDLEAVGGAGFDEVRHFVSCILEDRTPWSTLDDAVHTVRLCEAIRQGHQGSL